MTSSLYFIARIAQGFGYFRRNQRMAEAATEMHLLREAEAHLGFAVWESVGEIDQLSVEYWNLRRLIKEKESIKERLEASNEVLEEAQTTRIAILNSTPEAQQELLDERTKLLVELEELGRQRDEIIAEAREIRRFFDGMKMKIKVLNDENQESSGKQEGLDKAQASLKESKIRFAELKEKRLEIGKLIEAGDAKIDAVDQKLDQLKKDRRSDAAESFQAISEGNREVSSLRAEIGVLDTQMRQLYAEIGRYVSRNATHVPACSKVAVPHRSLVDIMRALRRSIALNHRLAGTA
jgi:DNA repair exonuclease SbcCD ATPase subunit